MRTMLKRMRSSWAVAVLTSIGLLGCGSDSSGGSGGGGGLTTSKKGEISVTASLGSPPFTQISFPATQPGAQQKATISIKNNGQGPLSVSGSFKYTVSTDTAANPAIRLAAIRQGSAAKTAGADGAIPSVSIEAKTANNTGVEIDVVYTNVDNGGQHDATLIINSDTLIQAQQRITIKFSTSGGRPKIDVDPKVVDFGVIKKDDPVEKQKKTITVTNTGSDPLLLSAVLFKGHPDFRLLYSSKDGTQSYEPALDDKKVVWDPAIVVNPQEVLKFTVQYAPKNADPAKGFLVFDSNDPAADAGTKVELLANENGPKIRVLPPKVDFGARKIGKPHLQAVQLSNVGTADLVISKIELTTESSTTYALEYKSLKGHEDGTAPTADKPVTLKVNEETTLNVTFTPAKVSDVDKDTGKPIPEIGTVLVESNAFESKVNIGLTGLGVEKECPNAVIVVQEGEQVIPQTKLHLFGDQSYAPTGAISAWKWAVKQASGSASLFVPSDAFPNPTFECNVAGSYFFSLDVWDNAGNKSCSAAEVEVVVVPDEAIHVELVWKTPNDPDETDTGPDAGSDLDLHFVHDQLAPWYDDLDKDGKPDPWFSPDYDSFWYHPKPAWGSFDPSVDDDPSLDRDDTDGAGPENLNLNIPENGTQYRVGVHYWADHDYGPAFATLRVYIFSNLVFELKDVELQNLCMWNAALIDWPSGKVTKVPDPSNPPKPYFITCPYVNKLFNP